MIELPMAKFEDANAEGSISVSHKMGLARINHETNKGLCVIFSVYAIAAFLSASYKRPPYGVVCSAFNNDTQHLLEANATLL